MNMKTKIEHELQLECRECGQVAITMMNDEPIIFKTEEEEWLAFYCTKCDSMEIHKVLDIVVISETGKLIQ